MLNKILIAPQAFGARSGVKRQIQSIFFMGFVFITLQSLTMFLLNNQYWGNWHVRPFILTTILNATLDLFVLGFIFLRGMDVINRALHDLHFHEATSQAILDHIADGVLVLNLQGDFFSANPALLAMIPEFELKEIIITPLTKTIRWKDKVFSVSVSEVPNVGTVAIFRDDTSRYEIERARGDLLANASHELRTPLTAIMNYLEFIQVLIRMGKINTSEFNEHITRALENVKRLQSLVNDILDQAQMRAGVMNLKQDVFNVRSTIEKAHQLLGILIEEKKLSYELLIESNVPVEIVGDSGRLYQTLVNLLGNAIKFTQKGGIKVYVSMMLEKISIQIIDSGAGISAEQLPEIFQAFKRGNNGIQDDRQGVGLGLSIAKELVTRMGGEISVFSELGHGTTFTILLPIKIA